MTTNQPQFNRMNRRDKQLIVYIMLNRRGLPLPHRPPTLFFSVPYPTAPMCPPKF